ncbi:MAG TPA: YsnF/AvaK domain-containing protein [Chloroflexota bacterium]|jgi:uncharacterized protein (TIGR02271 family)
MELRQEELTARKDLQQSGEIILRTRVEEVPGRLEVDAYAEDVEITHEPVGQVVNERGQPWEEDGTLIVPVYEEQLVVSKRLVLRERLRIRKVGTTQRQLFEDTVRREHLVIEDPQHTGRVHEIYPTGEETGNDEEKSDGGFLEHLARKTLQ